MTTFINSLTPDDMRAAVARQYGRVAQQPGGEHPFPVGRAFAESVGYPGAVLDSLPAQAVAAFAGISQPLLHARLQPGDIVLDLGCGGGMDTILAARQVGLTGTVHALDLSADMLACARANVAADDLTKVIFHQCPAEKIPLPNNSIDLVLVNGIFNLCPEKQPVADETFRVLQPGGCLLLSEIVVQDTGDEDEMIGETCGLTLDDWFT